MKEGRTARMNSCNQMALFAHVLHAQVDCSGHMKSRYCPFLFSKLDDKDKPKTLT